MPFSIIGFICGGCLFKRFFNMLKTKIQAENTNKKVDFTLNYSTLTQPNLTQANVVLSKINFICVFRLHFRFQHIKNL